MGLADQFAVPPTPLSVCCPDYICLLRSCQPSGILYCCLLRYASAVPHFHPMLETPRRSAIYRTVCHLPCYGHLYELLPPLQLLFSVPPASAVLYAICYKPSAICQTVCHLPAAVLCHLPSGCRWEAHIWVKELGRQVYLGGYEHEEHAAEAYDVAALKCKGHRVKTNFAADRFAVRPLLQHCYSLHDCMLVVKC